MSGDVGSRLWKVMLKRETLEIGEEAPPFSLPAVDGEEYSLGDFSDAQVLVVAFTCNHCPYVKAHEDRIIALQEEYEDRGVRLVAINSNDTTNYPEDSFDHMVERAEKKGYNFPYLRDKSQEVARAYGASHTPEFFVFDGDGKLRYHGRLDDNWEEPEEVERQYVREAIEAILRGAEVETPEVHSVGCTIKWSN